MTRAGRACALLAIASLLLLGCRGGSQAARAATATPAERAAQSAATPGDLDRPGVDAFSRVESDQRLVVTIDREAIGLKNGGTVRLGEGVTAELFIDPYPPSALAATLDVYLEERGRPVRDGFVSVTYDMLAMDHGALHASAKAIGDGHFLVPLAYYMYGNWNQRVAIRAGEHRAELDLTLIVKP